MKQRSSKAQALQTTQPMDLCLAALGQLAGAALILDGDLRIRAATEEVAEILGAMPKLGSLGMKVLCGDKPTRPVADALALGQSVNALIRRPTGALKDQWVRVRATPLSTAGWLVLLQPAGVADGDGAVCFHGFWTQDGPTKRVLRVVERAGHSDATVLVRGETGSGKELIAQAIHALSPRANGPFRAINCAALPQNLLDSELFGHVRGAFTGAVRDTPGHIEHAHQGTLFLDEVAEMPLELQAKLLRVLETHTVIPVGGRDPIPVDVRIVSATHRALRQEVAAGRFRADLMYRLRVIPVFIPALRERPLDVALLLEKFVAEMNRAGRRQLTGVSPLAMRALTAYSWPGNVRELRNVLSYALAMTDGAVLQLHDLPAEISGEQPAQSDELQGLDEKAAPDVKVAKDPRAHRIAEVLQRVGGHREQAAKILGMSRVTLWRRMKQYDLDG